MNNLFNRIIRASKLEPQLYEEVEADKSAFGQAMLVVILSSVAAGIGNISTGKLQGLIWGTILALISWFVWAYLTYLIGTRLLPEPQTESDPGELLRTIGFSSAPGIIRLIGIIPVLRSIVFLLASVWMLIAMIIGVRQALDYNSTFRAVGVCVIGWVVQLLILMLLFLIFGGPQSV